MWLSRYNNFDSDGVPTTWAKTGKPLTEDQRAKWKSNKIIWDAKQVTLLLDGGLEFQNKLRLACERRAGKFEGTAAGGLPGNRVAPCRYVPPPANEAEDGKAEEVEGEAGEPSPGKVRNAVGKCEADPRKRCNLEPCNRLGDVPIREVPGGLCDHAPAPKSLANPTGRPYACSAYFEQLDPERFPGVALRCEDAGGPEGECRRSHQLCNPMRPAQVDDGDMAPLQHGGKLQREGGGDDAEEDAEESAISKLLPGVKDGSGISQLIGSQGATPA